MTKAARRRSHVTGFHARVCSIRCSNRSIQPDAASGVQDIPYPPPLPATLVTDPRGTCTPRTRSKQMRRAAGAGGFTSELFLRREGAGVRGLGFGPLAVQQLPILHLRRGWERGRADAPRGSMQMSRGAWRAMVAVTCGSRGPRRARVIARTIYCSSVYDEARARAPQGQGCAMQHG